MTREREAKHKEKREKETERKKEQFVSHLKRRAIHRARCTRIKVLLWQREREREREEERKGERSIDGRQWTGDEPVEEFTGRYFGSSSE